MKTLEITKAIKSLADYAKQIEQESLIVLRNGKPVAVLSSAKGMDAESIAVANNPKFASIITRSRTRHETEGGMSIDEVKRRFRVAETKRRNRTTP